jgi:hypothetical protein
MTTCGTIVCSSNTHDSTSPPYHGRTRDTSGEPSPDSPTGKDGFQQPYDQLTLITTTPSTPSSTIPTSVRTALADPNLRVAMEEEYGT